MEPSKSNLPSNSEIRFYCTACGKGVAAEFKDIGAKVVCPHCANRVVVPESGTNRDFQVGKKSYTWPQRIYLVYLLPGAAMILVVLFGLHPGFLMPIFAWMLFMHFKTEDS